jgi:hypothetical protein
MINESLADKAGLGQAKEIENTLKFNFAGVKREHKAVAKKLNALLHSIEEKEKEN